ncbi:Zinc finger C2H2-type [Fusarium oxysporum f. sp. vasinfectum]|nr:Zinc finger C2H2-type [Fusarium oxysporum f. sp. vasinfectum]
MELMELVENEASARPFQCDWQSCTKSFNRKSDLQRHYRIHTNERPYACSIPGCGKSFIQRSALTVHFRTHTGEKPYQCQHIGCGKRFSDLSSLTRHRRIHTGKRPYKCAHNGCSKSFCQKTTMVKHQRREHQHEMNPDIDNCSSDSHDDESPSTPQRSSMTGSPHEMVSMIQGPCIVRLLTLILTPKSMVTTCPNTMSIDRGFPPVSLASTMVLPFLSNTHMFS